MAGSAAEERIREKTVAAMRRRWPEDRIVHELVLSQSSIRIAVAEIKSERDVLKRLAAQVRRAIEVADEVWIVVAPKHKDALDDLRGWNAEDFELGRTMRNARVLVETETGIELDAFSVQRSKRPPHMVDPRCRFDLLWRDEMASAIGRHFGGATFGATGKMTRDHMTRLAVEHMSGRELRRAVCAQLRDRPFPRADERASLIDVKRPNLFRPEAPQAQAVDPAFGEASNHG